ncbi:hypothetical protein [Parvularcula marina]|uniref:hypothetical protein n=1 Tax=Parvularcula marina TaxID=2292771 RepID=UPI003515FB6E
MKTGLAAVMIAFFSSAALADEAPSPRVKTAAFLEAVATKAEACEALRPWQSAALRALNLTDMERFSAEEREAVIAETNTRLAGMTCRDEAMTVWVEGARDGFDREMLPPYLIAYLTFVGYEDPPHVFTATTTRLRYGPAVEAIREKLAALEAVGVVPEGGRPWPEYIELTQSRVREFVAVMSDDETTPEEFNEAAGWMGQTAHIVELWLADQGV